MSVVPNNIFAFGSANMPEADSATIGGAVDFTKKVSFFDVTPTGALDVVSGTSGDTGVKMQISYRDATGVIQTPAVTTVTGTTVIANAFSSGTIGCERLIAGVLTGGAIAGLSNPGGTAAIGDIAVLAHTRTLSGRTAQTGAANTSGTTPPLMKLQSGDGATINALTFNGLGLIIRITGGTGVNQLRYVSVPYTAGAYGTDIVAINRDWVTIPDATSTYDIAQGFLFDVLPSGIASQTPVTAITRCFATAQADIPGGAQRIFYEKVFVDNLNTTIALTGASIQIASDSPALPGTATLDLGLESTLNAANPATNRQTLPNGTITFVVQPLAVNVIAGSGQLPSGAAPNTAGAQGVWLRLTLPAGTTAYKGAADLRVTGSTT